MNLISFSTRRHSSGPKSVLKMQLCDTAFAYHTVAQRDSFGSPETTHGIGHLALVQRSRLLVAKRPPLCKDLRATCV